MFSFSSYLRFMVRKNSTSTCVVTCYYTSLYANIESEEKISRRDLCGVALCLGRPTIIRTSM